MSRTLTFLLLHQSCATGTGQTSAATCLACAANTTSPSGSSSPSDCLCKRGYTDSVAGPPSATSRRSGAACSPCEAGYFKSSEGSDSCQVCPDGKFSDEASSACSWCPLNSNSSVPARGISACKCNAGYSGQDGGPCSQCPAGTFKSTTGWSGSGTRLPSFTRSSCHVFSCPLPGSLLAPFHNAVLDSCRATSHCGTQ
jgi:hypothetical protein